jgi:2,4-dienoyl-CoA reductase-like NADH-dependent reductase (Old Yellow Enzyme family)
MTRTYNTRPSFALFEQAEVGAFRPGNRIVTAPLTHNRAGPGPGRAGNLHSRVQFV